MAEIEKGAVRPIAYARFSRRLRALLLDILLVAIVFYVGAVVIGSLEISDAVRRWAWLGLLLALFLYEPVLLTTIGGTIGHRLSNLRVVDDRDDGNVGLLKAIARTSIKIVLGWYSFLTMALTRRHQAVHDVVTRSTVQIRDRSKASPYHFVAERAVETAAGLPSRARRIVVIVVYMALSYVVISLLSLVIVSDACERYSRCSAFELAAISVLAGAWLASTALFAILGWKGRLWGCRAA